jgi:hypothetical protein
VPSIPFASMPETARAWVFGACQPVRGSDADIILGRTDAFIRDWHAHGIPVLGASDWRYDHFLIVAADEASSGVSGCSIDSLFRTLREVEGSICATLLDSSLISFRDAMDMIRVVSRPEFRALVKAGEIDDSTIVFDNTVGTVGAIQNGEWERHFAGSWHERAFRRSAMSSPSQRTR